MRNDIDFVTLWIIAICWCFPIVLIAGDVKGMGAVEIIVRMILVFIYMCIVSIIVEKISNRKKK
jgi:hypothetical protein